MNARDPSFSSPHQRGIKKKPLPHQLDALYGISQALAISSRAKVIMACGTGKTLTQLWASESHAGAGQTIVFVPTLGLMSQSLQEWSEQQGDKVPFRYICVCSDDTVDSRDIDIDGDHFRNAPDTAAFKPTTDPAQVRRFLMSASEAEVSGQRSVVFCTYASAPVVAQAMRGIDGEFDLLPFDLGIFDEAHKTVGIDDKRDAFALADQRLPIRKRLFFTATPKIVQEVDTPHDHHAMRVVSMDNHRTYGDVAYSLGFAEAARRGLITRFQVIASFVNDANLTAEELASPDAKRIADTRALQLAMKEVGARKAITFHSRIDKALAFAQGINPSDMPAFHVNGRMDIRDRNRQLSAFGRASTGVMTNANCLTEGIDVPTVDMVAFMDPRQDVVGIGQAAGRAMRAAPGKDLGFILVPLRVDLAAGETVEQAIDRGNFHQIIQVLRSLTENDGEEGAWTTRLAGALESHDGAPPLLRLVGLSRGDEQSPASIDVARIREAISTRIVFGADAGFDFRIRGLEAFKADHGHCNVPRDYEGGLGQWVSNQRREARQPSYPGARRARLDALRFEWNPLDAAWERRFEELAAFRREYGHCNVPLNFGRLGKWATEQRQAARQAGYPEDRRTRLEVLGFDWNRLDTAWELRLEELAAFRREHGHCNVPTESGGLGRWVSTQRKAVKRAGYPEDRRTRLEVLGFEWNPSDTGWELRFDELTAFRREHGNCNVPTESGGLGQWVSVQRRLAKRPRYPEERRARLDAMGFEWNKFDTIWERRFDELAVFRKDLGHCNVPRDYESGLGHWVSTQRSAARRAGYPEDRRARLDVLGFDWNLLDSAWDRWFDELVAFRRENGHCNVPLRLGRLGQWVSEQRLAARRDGYTEERRARLDSLGFEWNRWETAWEGWYEQLAAFRQEHGHCNVPRNHPALSQWVANQRYLVKRPRYPDDRRARLTALGFDWSTEASARSQRTDLTRIYGADDDHGHQPQESHP